MIVSDTTICNYSINKLTSGSQRKIEVECDKCGFKYYPMWRNYLKKINKDDLCSRCATSIRNKKLSRSRHPSWNGGRYISSDGYVMINVKSGRDGKSGWSNYRKEHLVVMEEFLGRPLENHEVVHHIDGNKTNNCISNLYLTNSRGHRVAHISLQEIGYELLKCGKISFNSNTGKYEVNHEKH